MLTAEAPILAALLRGDLAETNRLLAARPDVRGRVQVELVENARAAAAAPVWRIDADGRSRFRFHHAVYGGAADLVFSRWLHMLPLIAAVLDSTPPAGRLSLNLGDTGHRPGLAFCDHRPGYRLIPDPVFLMTANYAEVAAIFAGRMIPYEERAPVAFWRGTSTGPSGAGTASLPRLRLCRLARDLGDAADVGLSSLTPPFRDAEAALRAEGLMRDYVPIHDLDRYRVHIDIDGNSASWPGLMAKLHSGSPVLKVASPAGFRQWYYDRLEPWTHYVPVAPDLSDLAEKVRLLLADAGLAARIGAAGRALAQSMVPEAEIAQAVPGIVGTFDPLD